jgi:hypothetical protein
MVAVSVYKCKELLTGECVRVLNVTSQKLCGFDAVTQPYAMANATKVLTQDANIHACNTQQDLPLTRNVSCFRTSTCIHLRQTIIRINKTQWLYDTDLERNPSILLVDQLTDL